MLPLSEEKSQKEKLEEENATNLKQLTAGCLRGFMTRLPS